MQAKQRTFPVVAFIIALSLSALSGCDDDDTITIASSTCLDCPFTISASISPNQDVAMTNQAENITITFNEPMAEINLNLIRLERLGLKGGEVSGGSGLFPDVPIAVSLSPDRRTLIIDIDPDNDPNTPLDPGMAFAVIGFETLFDTNDNPFGSSNPNNFLPSLQEPFFDANGNGVCDPGESFTDANGNGICDTARFLRFTTNADATLLALSAAPVQTPNSAQNGSPLFVSANLDIEFGAQAPSGARAFQVFASPGGRVTNPSLLCKVFESSFAESPPTDLSIPLSTIASALNQCHRPLDNTQWDDGLTIDVAVAVVNADGKIGPLSAILTAKDNINPQISSSFSVGSQSFFAGAQAGDFQIRIVFTEEMAETALTNLANYAITSADADSYTVTDVRVSPGSDPTNPTSADLFFTLISAAPAPTTMVESELNNDTATADPVTSLPAQISGFLSCCPEPADFFSFPGTVGQQVRAVLTLSCCPQQPQLTLFDTDGTTALANVVGSFTTIGPLVATLPRNGTFFLRVRDAFSGCCPSFSYSLLLATGPDGLVSDGDTITLDPAIIDEAGNSIDPSANTLTVSGSTLIIGGTP